MADYIYLLQNRLSAAQQAALQTIRDVAKAHGVTVFLVGGAVRDLTSGSPVRDLDVVVQGSSLKLKKEIELAGAQLAGEVASWQTFFAHFPGGVRVEIGSTLSVAYPKPGKPVAQAATILDDLRRRDFTANAMALSLNEGSYGLLMDPLNGVADIENRQLRLVSNYGFIEDPVRMIRAARFSARLGWTMDEKTQARYETGKVEKYISAMNNAHRGYETEEIFHEEDPLRVLRKLEEEGWMKHLYPGMTVSKVNIAELERLREVQTQLQVSGINPDAAAANFPLMTAKLSAAETAELKKSFVRQGFVREVENLETEAKEFASQLAGKGASLPSQAWRLIHAAKPEAVLWVAYSSKNPVIQAKLKSFHTEWPKARQKMPFALMQEMRIVPELDSFNDVVEKVFFELMDGNLTTPEEQKAFLEPFSPPAPPPPVRLARSRAGKKDGKTSKGKKKVEAILDEDEDADLDSEMTPDDTLHGDNGEDTAPLPDDENEDIPNVVPAMERETEEISEALQHEPEPITAPPSEPLAATPSPALASKPKRVRAVTVKSASPMAVESAASIEVPQMHAVKAKAAGPAKKTASPPVKASAVQPATKNPGKAAVPVVPPDAAKLPAKPIKMPAKTALPTVTPKAAKSIKAAPPTIKKTGEKQPSAAKDAAKVSPPLKAPTRKEVSAPSRLAAKNDAKPKKGR